jgi:hypothetical protein
MKQQGYQQGAEEAADLPWEAANWMGGQGRRQCRPPKFVSRHPPPTCAGRGFPAGCSCGHARWHHDAAAAQASAVSAG